MPMVLARRGGTIIDTSSIFAVMTNRDQANYPAEKSQFIETVKAQAWELTSRSITVNIVTPSNKTWRKRINQ